MHVRPWEAGAAVMTIMIEHLSIKPFCFGIFLAYSFRLEPSQGFPPFPVWVCVFEKALIVAGIKEKGSSLLSFALCPHRYIHIKRDLQGLSYEK